MLALDDLPCEYVSGVLCFEYIRGERHWEWRFGLWLCLNGGVVGDRLGYLSSTFKSCTKASWRYE